MWLQTTSVVTEEAPPVYAGTTRGMVTGQTFMIGYVKDIVVPVDTTVEV